MGNNQFFEGVAMNNSPIDKYVEDWKVFYRDMFDIDTDFKNIKIPPHQQDFDRLIIVTKGMNPDRLYHKCRENFFGWTYTDKGLNEIVSSDRTSKDCNYAVWFRDTVEADEDLQNISADELKQRGISGITLEERLLFELKYYSETGWHLDSGTTFTLCSGSRYVDGYVPTVRYRIRNLGLNIHWYKQEDRFSDMRSRRAIL
jgi:hypothetical protein